MNTTKPILAAAALFVAGVLTAHAQYEETTTTTTTYDSGGFGAYAGDWELTLGGSGGSNNDLDTSLGGVNASLGYFLSDTLEISVRQSMSYSNGAGGGAEYDGSTFVALDQHFGTARLRPFIGVSAGGLYGDNTNNTFAAGLETGLKFYVQPKTFIFAHVNYVWTFEDSDTVGDNFDDGGFLWALGVGFNF